MGSPTRLLLSTSAIVLGLMGLVATFAPQELVGAIGVAQSPHLQLMVQLLGALYLGFANMNWMARGSTIGGIYNRPIVVGNLTHFLVGALTIVRAVAGALSAPWLWPLALIYAGYAVGFGVLLFRHPVAEPRR